MSRSSFSSVIDGCIINLHTEPFNELITSGSEQRSIPMPHVHVDSMHKPISNLPAKLLYSKDMSTILRLVLFNHAPSANEMAVQALMAFLDNPLCSRQLACKNCKTSCKIFEGQLVRQKVWTQPQMASSVPLSYIPVIMPGNCCCEFQGRITCIKKNVPIFTYHH